MQRLRAFLEQGAIDQGPLHTLQELGLEEKDPTTPCSHCGAEESELNLSGLCDECEEEYQRSLQTILYDRDRGFRELDYNTHQKIEALQHKFFGGES